MMRPGSLWAVTSYFNPAHYGRRRENYRVFRQHLAVPLVAVELSFDGTFELEGGDADILVRVTGGDVMWQKQRLLLLGLRHLPSDCRAVACLDCDIVFGRDDWAECAAELLDIYSVIQPFSLVYHMPRHWVPGSEVVAGADAAQPSLAFTISRHGGDPAALDAIDKRGPGTLVNGFAWVYRRDLLEGHGLYDACIVGGGETAMICAASGNFEAAVRRQRMNRPQARHYRRWAHLFHDAVRGSVGHLDGEVFHLWHGSLSDRRYVERYEGLRRHYFDPIHDIALDDGGCWRWSSNKPALHSYVREYFAARREDG